MIEEEKNSPGEIGMSKRAIRVILTAQELEALVQVTKRHRSEQQQVLRARIVLAAAEGRSNAQIARELAITGDTVRLWRDRWVGLQGIDWETLTLAERLQDAPREGNPTQVHG
jgi:5,10-methylenetetrahydrofolate reductase